MDARIHGTVTQKQASGKTQTIPADSTPRDCVRHINIKFRECVHPPLEAGIDWLVCSFGVSVFLSPVKVSDTENV